MAEFDPFVYCFDCMSRLPSRNGVCPACGKDNRTRLNGEDELPFCYLANRKYIVGKALGRGGFGITYIGLNSRLGKRVAIKEYFPAEIARRNRGSLALEPVSPETGERLVQGRTKVLNEARIIAQVEDIPNIVRIYDCFTRNNTAYIVMEYVQGQTLASMVAQKGPMPWDTAWSILKPIGEALKAMHTMEMIHRDISPDNIMIRRDNGQSVLLDFGAAGAMLRESGIHSGLVKDGYAAMEQYRETSILDGRTDEYAWAATFYYALTGCRPETAMQRSYNPGCTRPPRKLKARISPAAEQAIMKGMEVKQDDRYPTMDELLQELFQAASVQEKKSRRPLAAMLAAGLVCAGSVTAGMVGAPAQKEKVGWVDDDTPLYERPGNEQAIFLNRETYFSLIHITRGQGPTTWYEVRIPVEGVLRTYYLDAQDAQMLDEAAWQVLLQQHRGYQQGQ